MSQNRYFTSEEEHAIVKTIKKAEKNTSGEIRVHISKTEEKQSLEFTKALFWELKMNETERRNAVLIHVSLASQSFAIFGDEGIDSVSSDTFWDSTRDKMLFFFKKNQISEGIIAGIQEIGEVLKVHFPTKKHKNNENELDDEVTYS